jgi:lipid-A-disaccharide synthase
MVNLILGREEVPELVQDDLKGEAVAAHLEQLIPDGPVRERQFKAFAELRQKLHPAVNCTAAERAAEVILDSL